MKEKMKRDKDEREEDYFVKNVSEPSHPPDELAQNVSNKSQQTPGHVVTARHARLPVTVSRTRDPTKAP